MSSFQPAVDGDDSVVLVDERDRVLGVAPKLQAHRDGRLHRAVSVVLFDDVGRVLLQRRATAKYHSGGLWSNTCCGHPRPGESVGEAAGRRLEDELGIGGCQLLLAGQFVYFAELADGLVEHELDHVLIGRWTEAVRPNPAEVSEIQWLEPGFLRSDLEQAPAAYTAWAAKVIDVALGRDVDAVSAGG